MQGSVAKSTHAGIPWLRYIRQRMGDRVQFWPFDGWDIPAGRSAIIEVYLALWSRDFPREGRTGNQHDIREMEHDFDTGYETGYKIQQTDDVSRNLAVFDCKSRINV